MTRVPFALLLALAASSAFAAPVPPLDAPVPPLDAPVPPLDVPVPPLDVPVPPLDVPHLAPPFEGRPRLEVDRSGAVAVAAGALVAWGINAAASANVGLGACRWCQPSGFDRAARSALRWRDTAAAGSASDTLRVGVPLASAAAVAWLAAREGGRREVVEDVLTVAAAVGLAAPITDAVKHGTGRLRPGAWAAGGPTGEVDLHSFFSSHVSRVAAAAAAATQVARLRGRAGWKWLAVAGIAASAGTAWLRMAADQHWATDVLAGGAAGAAVGLAVPPLMLRRRGEKRRGRVTSIAPAPGGLAIVF